MGRAEKDAMLGANLPREYVENFWIKALPEHSNANKTEIVIAMASAWLELPDEMKKHYLYPSKDGFHFIEAIENMIDKKVEAKIDRVINGQLIQKTDEDCKKVSLKSKPKRA